MSEEKAPYSAGDQLTFHGLVNDLKKLRAEQEHIDQEIRELARVYPGLARNKHFGQIDAKTLMLLVSYDDVIREYQGRNEKAEEITQYNAEMDARNQIILDSREKPWLPYHDGE